MLRRRIIRVLFLLPMLFLIGIWITSYYMGRLGAGVVAKRLWVLGFTEGKILFIHAPLGTSTLPTGERFRIERLNIPASWWGGFPTFGGFRVSRYPPLPDSALIVMPIWFSFALLALINVLVWPKTRRKSTGKAFPVEPERVLAEVPDASRDS
jgi:hypothetical protein